MSSPVVESRAGRRIICRLAEGEELVASVRAICVAHQVRAATFFVSGVLDSVALAHYAKADRAMGAPRWFRTPVQILAAQGHYSEKESKPELHLFAVVSRVGENGIEVLGGEVTAAPVLSCELVIDSMDDVFVRSRVDPKTGIASWTELLGKELPATPSADQEPLTEGEDAAATPASAAGDQGGKGSTAERWAAAAAASSTPAEEEEEEEDDEEEEHRPMRSGDMIDHVTFGLCEVERVDGDGEFAIVRLRNKRLVRLNLDVLDLRFVSDEEGRQLFGPRR